MSDFTGPEMNMLQQLAMHIQGTDIYGRRLSSAEQQAAVVLWEQIKQRKAERDLASQAQQLEQKKLVHQVETKGKELDLEQQRINVQKAEVFVKALAVGMEGGIQPEQLLFALQGLGKVLTGTDLLLPSTEMLPQLTVRTGKPEP